MLRSLVLLAMIAASPALAQQQTMSTTALQQQRNLAFDLQAQAIAQIEILTTENIKLKARVEELEKQSALVPNLPSVPAK